MKRNNNITTEAMVAVIIKAMATENEELIKSLYSICTGNVSNAKPEEVVESNGKTDASKNFERSLKAGFTNYIRFTEGFKTKKQFYALTCRLKEAGATYDKDSKCWIFKDEKSAVKFMKDARTADVAYEKANAKADNTEKKAETKKKGSAF